MNLRNALAKAIKSARKRKHFTQEDLGVVSSRTYLSTLERGLKSPTLDKLDEICRAMEIHPAAIVLAAYGAMNDHGNIEASLEAILAEAQGLLVDMKKTD